MSYAKIRPRRGTINDWTLANPVLEQGEIAVEYPLTGVGSGLVKIKIGDGINTYTNLPYALDGDSASGITGGGVSDFHLIQLRAATAAQWASANPVIAENEIVFDTTNNAIKIGDGINNYLDLDFINAGGSLATDYDFGNEDLIN